jgi:hypothetical protein
MKITRRQLKQIIQEELENILYEQRIGTPRYGAGFRTDFGPGNRPHRWEASARADVPGVGGATFRYGSEGGEAIGRVETPIGRGTFSTDDPEQWRQDLQPRLGRSTPQLGDDPHDRAEAEHSRAKEGEHEEREALASRIASGFRSSPSGIRMVKPYAGPIK